jgi:hypothetical protein
MVALPIDITLQMAGFVVFASGIAIGLLLGRVGK